MAYGRQHAFFLFFMVGFMKTMIEADYERGLKTLTEYVESGGGELQNAGCRHRRRLSDTLHLVLKHAAP